MAIHIGFCTFMCVCVCMLFRMFFFLSSSCCWCWLFFSFSFDIQIYQHLVCMYFWMVMMQCFCYQNICYVYVFLLQFSSISLISKSKLFSKQKLKTTHSFTHFQSHYIHTQHIHTLLCYFRTIRKPKRTHTNIYIHKI